MSLQHIQAKQHIHRLVFQNGERTRKEVSLYLDLSWIMRNKKRKKKEKKKEYTENVMQRLKFGFTRRHSKIVRQTFVTVLHKK